MPRSSIKWNSLRRLAISLACALTIVLLASRTNRPVPLQILTPAPRPGDEILKSVTIDMRSINASLASFRAVSKTNIILDRSLLDPKDKFITDEWPDMPPLVFKNVRLRSALETVLHFRNPYVMELREDAGSITVGGSGTSLVPVYLRIYDIRDLIPAPRPAQPLTPTYSQQQSLSPQQESSDTLEYIFQETTLPGAWQDQWFVHVWSGWLFVNASDKGQRGVQQMLLILRTSGTLNASEGKSTP